jgi:ATP-binding cassette subfamily B protein
MGYIAIVVAGGSLAIARAITVGDIQAFIQYVKSFSQPLGQLAGMSNMLQQTAAAAERIFAFLAEKEESPEDSPIEAPETVRGEGSFDKIRFGYAPDAPVIKSFSATAKQGQKIAIVGPTGAGKTTIVKLLMRFYDPDSGAITIDGRDIARLPRSGVRRLFGMVLQDAWLFSGSIMENIRYGRTPATRGGAAAKTPTRTIIRAQPRARHQIIESRQHFPWPEAAIDHRRAILANRPCSFDELQARSNPHEALNQNGLTPLWGQDKLVIAHRRSTIRNSDLFLVMKDGDIVEQEGTQNYWSGAEYTPTSTAAVRRPGPDRMAGLRGKTKSRRAGPGA